MTIYDERLCHLLHPSSIHRDRLADAIDRIGLTPESYAVLHRCYQLEGVTYCDLTDGASVATFPPGLLAELIDDSLIVSERINYLGITFYRLTDAGHTVLSVATMLLRHAYGKYTRPRNIEANVLPWPSSRPPAIDNGVSNSTLVSQSKHSPSRRRS